MSTSRQTLEQMANRAANLVGDNNTNGIARIKEWIALHYQQLVDEYNWPELIRVREEKDSFVGGERYLYLPKYVSTILGTRAFLVHSDKCARS